MTRVIIAQSIVTNWNRSEYVTMSAARPWNLRRNIAPGFLRWTQKPVCAGIVPALRSLYDKHQPPFASRPAADITPQRPPGQTYYFYQCLDSFRMRRIFQKINLNRYFRRDAIIIPRLLPSRNLPLHPGNFYVPPNLLSDIVFCISLI